MVFVDGLNSFCDPVVHEFDPGRVASVRDGVEVGPLRVVLIAAGQSGNKVEMEDGMIGDAGLQADFFAPP